MDADEPDWRIDASTRLHAPLTDEHRELFATIAAISASTTGAALMSALRAPLRDLHASGLTFDRIAAEARLTIEAVRAILR